MRSALLPIAAWLGALQSMAAPSAPASTVDQTARLVAIASMLGSLTVLVYRLGVWRQQMESCRSEMTACFERIERRIERLEAGKDG